MRPRLALAIVLLAPFSVNAALAQDAGDAARAQLRQVTLQLRQLQDDQATLQAAKVAAEQERDALKKQLAAAQAELAHAKHSGPSVQAVQAVQQDLAKAKGQLSQAADAAKQNQAERDKLQSTVANTHTLLDACEVKNTALLKVGHEILTAYEKFDLVDAVGAKENFIGLKRVELENLAQGYEDRIEDGRYDPRAVHAPAAAIQALSAPAPTTTQPTPAPTTQ